MEKFKKYDIVFYNSNIKIFWSIEYITCDGKDAIIHEITVDSILENASLDAKFVPINLLRKAF